MAGGDEASDPKGQPTYGRPGIVRAQICVDVDSAEEAAVRAWFERRRERLTYISDDSGCGCCVRIWNVDGPEDVIAEIPAAARAVRS